MTRLRLDLLATVAAAGFHWLLVIAGYVGPLRVASGFLVTLVLPGYAVLAALGIPSRHRLSPAQHIALAIPLSLATVPIAGLVLNAVGMGIGATIQASALAVLIFVCSAFGITRSTELHSGSVAGAPFAATLVVAALCIGAVGAGLEQQRTPDLVRLSVVGSDGTIEAIPHEVNVGGAVNLILAVDYLGPGRADFRLDGPAQSWNIVLSSGETWSQPVSVTIVRQGATNLVFNLAAASGGIGRSVTVRVIGR